MIMPSRFWQKVDFQDSCWEWTGAKTKKGYGSFRLNRKALYAHRVAYQAARGFIPGGLVIDHLCRKRDCVNPAHMELVTNAENVWRGDGWTAQNRRKTVCVRGHALPPVTPGVSCKRTCLACEEYKRTRGRS